MWYSKVGYQIYANLRIHFVQHKIHTRWEYPTLPHDVGK